MHFFFVSLFAVLSVSPPLHAESEFMHAMSEQQLVAAGRESFVRHCSGCHGVNADGKGPAAFMLVNKPRNLVSGEFKFRSTPSGQLPTVSDLLRTINQGVPTTSMPPFRMLSEQEKLSLVAYIRSLRPEFKETTQRAVPLPPPPEEIFGTKAGLMKAASQGRKLFIQGCMQCHGVAGKGDGPSSATLVDSEENPIKPANLGGRNIKSGPTAQDAFRSVSMGLDGAPMPGFAASFSEADRWNLVAYIFYLRGKTLGIYSESDELK